MVNLDVYDLAFSRPTDHLKGRKALITGDDSGIGRAVAIAFAREGADVAIGYLPSEEIDAGEVIALIKQVGVKALALPGDITDEAWCRSLVSQTIEAFGGLDILVVNAGHQQFREDVSQVALIEDRADHGSHFRVDVAEPDFPLQPRFRSAFEDVLAQ